MSDHAAPVPIADERTRRIFGDLSFSSAKKGFDPAEVTAFLVNASGAVERMLGRLKEAEQRAEAAEARATQLEYRVLQPPSALPAPPAPPTNADGNGLLRRNGPAYGGDRGALPVFARTRQGRPAKRRLAQATPARWVTSAQRAE